MDFAPLYSKNIVQAQIDADGNVIVGDGNTIVNLKEAAQYKAIVADIEALNERFNKARERHDKYPDDPEFGIEMLRIDGERSQKQEELEGLKKSVIELAQEFQRIPINTERLRKAKEHFEKGEFAEARAVFDAEKELMERELSELKNKEANLEEQLKETQDQLADKANEYLILARLTAMNFDLPNRFEQTVQWFEKSLDAARTGENLFAFALFLQEHNEVDKPIALYKKSLDLFRKSNEQNFPIYLPNIANTLNNLANLYNFTNRYSEAEEFYLEALSTYKELAVEKPYTFLPDVVMTLNNISILYNKTKRYSKAEEGFLESLGICKELAVEYPYEYQYELAKTLNNLANLYYFTQRYSEAESSFNLALSIKMQLVSENPLAYLPSFSMTLSNLALFYSDTERYIEAEEGLLGALCGFKGLAVKNPRAHLPHVANTLNNLANLYNFTNQYSKAEEGYMEALEVFKELAAEKPHAFLPDMAGTLNNLANLFKDTNRYSEAEEGYWEALGIRRELAKENPRAYLPDVAMTLANMGIFFTKGLPDKKKAVTCANEVLQIAAANQDIPRLIEYTEKAVKVLQANGVDLNDWIGE